MLDMRGWGARSDLASVPYRGFSSAVCLMVPLLLAGGPAARGEEGGYFMPPSQSDGRKSGGIDAGTKRGQTTAGVKPDGAAQAANRVNAQIAADQYYVTAPRLDLSAKFDSHDFSHVGPFAVEHSDASPSLLEHGRTVTLAYPVKGVKGMDLTINTFAGHRETNTGSNVGSTAVTAGVRFKW
ncbi:hypothetical protein GOB93_05085 [Acetobacter musti]|uniref:Autotransporter domain-containing protein n=1 Tax=Acetobacter musti TaxID=864732 RepID=A0ABX0JLA9_9PROT|nr:hypothetical protein [Acetobacter musti]NHN84017.1 hypothetical protein [Acetobacter musti]